MRALVVPSARLALGLAVSLASACSRARNVGRGWREHVARQAGLVGRLVSCEPSTDSPRVAPPSDFTCGRGIGAFGALHVRVRDGSGAAMSGAWVSTADSNCGMPFEGWMTGRDGSAHLSYAASGIEIRVEHDGYVPVLRTSPGPRDAALEVVMTPGVEILRGRVVDQRDVPVQGARIALRQPDIDVCAWSDVDGQFRLVADRALELPPELAFDVGAAGFCFLARDLALPVARTRFADGVKLVVHSWAELRVEVTDAASVPILDCQVRVAWDGERADRFEFPFDAPMRLRSLRVGNTYTGEFEPIDVVLGRVPPLVPLWVEVSRDGRVLANQPIEPLPCGASPRIFVVIADAPSERHANVFRVVDALHAPCADARVTLRFPRNGELARRPLSVDPFGRARLETLPEDFELEASAQGVAPVRVRFPAGFASSSVVDLVLGDR